MNQGLVYLYCRLAKFRVGRLMASMKKKVKLRNVLVLVTAGLLTLTTLIAGVEILSNIIISKTFSRPGKPTIVEFIASKPLPFSGAPDYGVVATTQFSSRCPPERIIVKKNGFPKYEADNFSCEGEKIVNGLRHTTDQPANYKNEIHVFGGSTVWGIGSSDYYTIPSILQRHVNQKYPQRYKVVNRGFIAVVAKQELDELKDVKINSGDIVIFYDGGNDVWLGAVYGKPGGTIIGYNDENKWGVLLNKVKFFLSKNSNFYRLLALIKSTTNSSRDVDPYLVENGEQCRKTNVDSLQENFEVAYASYAKTLVDASNYVHLNRASFYHFFQPTLFSRSSPFSNYEMSLIMQSPSGMIPCGTYNDAYQKGYSFFKEKYQSKVDFVGFDLTEVLNPLKDNREYFIDFIHVSSPANEKIANEIFHSIFDGRD